MELVGKTVPGATGTSAEGAAALDHEPVDDAMETKAVVEFPGLGLARGRVTVFLGAPREADEVRHRVGSLVVEQLDDDVTLGGVKSSCAHAPKPTRNPAARPANQRHGGYPRIFI